jgi:hypothetical protein
MGLIGVVGLDLGVIRALWPAYLGMLLNCGLAVIFLQVALYLTLRLHGRARVFWLGFLAAGLIATLTLVWASFFPEVVGLQYNARTGSTVSIRTPGSVMFRLWGPYGGFASRCVNGVGRRLGHPAEDHLAPLACALAVLWLLPQGLIALAGGLVARGLVPSGETRIRVREGEGAPPAGWSAEPVQALAPARQEARPPC